MTASIKHIANTGPEPLRVVRTRNGPTDSFDSLLSIEQADALMRQTDQYAQWQRISQNDDSKVARIAELVLAREALFRKQAQGKAIDQQHFDRLTAQLRLAGLTLPTAQKIPGEKNNSTHPVSISQPLPIFSGTEEVSSSSSLLDEENLLILNMVSPAVGLNQTVLGYGDQQTTQLPLGETARALSFSITVDAEAGVATGWFIAEDRTFSLDAGKRAITIDGKSYPWDDGRISVGEDDIFVDSRTLSEWFPVDFEVSRGELAVTLTPREKLPLQTQYEREQKRLGLLGQEDMSLRYSLSEAPYELFSFPVLDFSISGGVGTISQDTSDYQARYSLVAEGDLGYMGAQVFVSGLEDEWLNTARVTLNRFDQDAGLLGPMRASQIYLGDISPVDLSVLGRPRTERGVAVSNADLYRSDDFDTTRFEGNMQPGWDVELYRNDALVDSMRVRGDGRYLFDDIPVFFGLNSFRVLAFGPQGQRRVVEEKDINVGSGMRAAGDFEYKLSASERKNTVLGIDEQTSGTTDDGGRFNGKFGLGLTDTLSVTAGASSVEFDDTRHNYLQAGLSGSFSSFYGQADYIYDTASGSGLSLQGQTALGQVNVKAKYESFDDFIQEDRPNSVLQSKTSLGIDGRIPKFAFIPSLAYTLSTENTTYTNSDTGRASAKLAGRVKSVHLSNVINWNYSGTNSDSGRIVDGDFQAVGSVGRGRINAGLRYALGEQDEINQYRLSGIWPIMQDISGGASLVQYAGENERTSAKLNLDWDTGQAMLSPSVSYDTDGGFGAFLTLTFSLGRDPVSEDVLVQSERRAGKGATTAFVYHDANNNRVFDQNDAPLSEVEIVARQARKKSLTNDDGMAYLTGLTAYNPTDVEVDVETLEDPFWQPAVSGTAVVPRAGSVNTLEIPVVTTGEIDGTVYSLDGNGVREELSNVQLEIVDGDGVVVQTVTSEYDGFYLFEKVFPGTYTLRVIPNDQRFIDPAAELQVEIVIGNDGTIAGGNDIILQPPASESQDNAPGPALPSSASSSSGTEGLSGAITAVGPPVVTAPASSITIRPMTIVADTGSSARASTPVAGRAEPPAPATTPAGPEKSVVVPEIFTGNDGTIAGGNDGILQAPSTESERNAPDPVLPPSASSSPGTDGPGRAITAVGPPEMTAPASSITIRPMTIVADTGSSAQASTPVAGRAEPPAPATTPAKPEESVAASVPAHSRSIAELAVVPAEEESMLKPDAAARNGGSGGRNGIRRVTPAVIQPFVPIGRPFDLGFPVDAGHRGRPVTPPSFDVVQQPSMASQLSDSREQSVGTGSEVPAEIQGRSEQEKLFAVHLSSYRSREAARVGLEILSERLAGIVTAGEFAIKKVDLGAKGVWYRVVCGRFERKDDADTMAGRMQPRTEYAKSIVMNSRPSTSIKIASMLPTQSLQTGPYAQVAEKYAAMQRRK